MIKWKEEQLAAIKTLGTDVVVSASAGSGKTTVMIERIKQLILTQKVPLSNMMVVTFTRAAAADIKEKLSNSLIDALKECDNVQDMQFISDQIEYLPLSNVGTLHSFCQQLLRKYFFVAQVSPSSDILSTPAATALAHEILDKIIEQKRLEGEPQFMQIYNMFFVNRSEKKFREAIYKLFSFAYMEAQPFEWLENACNIYDDKEKLSNLAINFLAPEYLALHELLDKDLEKAKIIKFAKGQEYLEKLKQLLDGESVKFTINNIEGKEEFCDKCRVFREFINKFNKRRRQLLDFENLHQAKDKAQLFCQLAIEFGKLFVQQKIEASTLEFGDLEHLTLRILKSQPEIKKELAYIFVDEYQDISAIQDEIISLCSTGDNVFYVGDVKQSIYGFRLSRPQIFLDQIARLEGTGNIYLNANFRSGDKILELTNRVFCGLMTKNFGQVDYEKEAQLRSGLDEVPKAYVKALAILNPPPAKPQEVYDVTQAASNSFVQNEARLIAERISKDLGKLCNGKPLMPSDFAILRRRRADAQVYINALAAYGIPAQVDKEEQIEPAVSALISCLRVLDNEYKDEAFLHLLKSPLYGFSDSQIFVIRSAFKDEKFLVKSARCYAAGDAQLGVGCLDTSLVSRLLALFDDLKRWSSYLSTQTVPELLAKIVAEKQYFKTVLNAKNGAQKQKKIEAFLSKCAQKSYADLYSFLHDYDKGFEGSDDRCGVTLSQAVSIMTIHGSKGLEFECVYIAECGVEHSSRKKSALCGTVADIEVGLGFEQYDEETEQTTTSAVTELIALRKKKEAEEEEMRILYVALTRARTYLYLVGTLNIDKEGRVSYPPTSYFGRTLDAMDENPEYIDSDSLNVQDELKAWTLPQPYPKEVGQELDRYLQFEYKHVAVQPKLTVTQLQQEQAPKNQYIALDGDFGAHDAIFRGNAYHKFMSLAEFGNIDAAAQVQQLLKKGKLSEQEVSALQLDRLSKVLEHPYFLALRDKKIYAEKSFLLNVPHSLLVEGASNECVVVQGIIDLMVLEEGGISIIDYKTTKANEQGLKDLYSKQLEIYALAAKTILNLPILRTGIYSFYLDKLIWL